MCVSLCVYKSQLLYLYVNIHTRFKQLRSVERVGSTYRLHVRLINTNVFPKLNPRAVFKIFTALCHVAYINGYIANNKLKRISNILFQDKTSEVTARVYYLQHINFFL